MEFVLGFLCVLTVVTVLGHGLWLLLEYVLRVLSGEKARTQERHPCPRCRRPIFLGRRHCVCGLDLDSSQARELDDLNAMARELRLLEAEANLDAEVVQKLRDTLTSRKRLLLGFPEKAEAGVLDVLTKKIPPLVEPTWVIPETAPPVLEAMPEVLPAVEQVIVLENPAVPEPLPAPPPTPPRPRRSFSEVLAGFMEERNILWGELVGGLLIVGSSIALVVSLWQTLQQIPYFPFFIFAALNSAVFAAGLYTLHHWKLQATSRGLLIIAMLLVPLDFLVMAGLTIQMQEDEVSWTAVRYGGEVVVLGLFAWLMRGAARVLTPEAVGALLLAVLGASTSQLAVPHLLHEQRDLWRFLLLGSLPVLSYAVASGWHIARFARQETPTVRHTSSLLAFLGLATFPVLVALGFLVYWSQEIGAWEALRRLAPLVALCGLPALAGGLLLRERKPAQEEAEAWNHAFIGTLAALCGICFLVGALVLAWPHPALLLLVSGLDVVVLTAVAFRWAMPAAHLAAIPCLAFALSLVVQVALGRLPLWEPAEPWEVISALNSPTTGSALVLLAAGLVLGAEILVRQGRRIDGIAWARGAACVGLAGLVLVNVHGVQTPEQATLATGLCALVCLLAQARVRTAEPAYMGLGLLVATQLWGLWWYTGEITSLWPVTVAALAFLLTFLPGRAGRWILTPSAWRVVGSSTAILAAGLLLTALSLGQSWLHPATSLLLAGVAFMLAWDSRSPQVSWLGSALLFASLWHASWLASEQWGLIYFGAWAALTHASICIVAAFFLTRWAIGAADFAWPLQRSALVSSWLTLYLLLISPWSGALPVAGGLAWLGLVWLVIAWQQRWHPLFACFQIAWSAAAVYLVTAWLEQQAAWLPTRIFSEGLADPWSLQAYGLGLGLLGLFWNIARVSLRQQSAATHFLQPDWPAADQVITAFVLLGQMGLALWGVLPGIFREFSPQWRVFQLDILPNLYRSPFEETAWLLWGALLAFYAVALWTRRSLEAVLGQLVLALTLVLLLAGGFASNAEASALRWGLTLCFVVGTTALVLRQAWTPWAERAGIRLEPVPRPVVIVRGFLIASTVVPVLVLTITGAMLELNGFGIRGPAEGSLFAWMGQSFSELTPLVLLGLALLAHAWREESSGYAFSAGWVFNLAVTGGYALTLVADGRVIDDVDRVMLLQLASLVAAVWALLWMANEPLSARYPRIALRSPQREQGPLLALRTRGWLVAQIAIPCASQILLFVVAASFIVRLVPEQPWLGTVASMLGWLAFAATVGAVGWWMWNAEPRGFAHLLPVVVLSLLAVLFPCAEQQLDGGPWEVFSSLTAGIVISMFGIEGIALARRTHPLSEKNTPEWLEKLGLRLRLRPAPFLIWLDVLALSVVCLALRATVGGPWPFFFAFMTALVAGLLAVPSVRWRLTGHAVAACLLINVAGGMLWAAWAPMPWTSFAYTHVLCFGVASLWFTGLQRLPILRQRSWLDDGPSALLSVVREFQRMAIVRHRPLMPVGWIMALAGTVGLVIVVSLHVLQERSGVAIGELPPFLPWTALATVAIALLLTLWDCTVQLSLPALYAVGGCAVTLGLHLGITENTTLHWAANLAVVGYVLLAAGLSYVLPKQAEFLQRLKLSPRPWPEAWFAPVQSVVGFGVVAVSLWLALDSIDTAARWTSPAALLLLALACVLLTEGQPVSWARDLRYATLILGVFTTATAGFALLPLGDPMLWLYRNIALMLALAALTALYGIVFVRILEEGNPWRQVSRRLGPVLGLLASILLVLVVFQEALYYQPAPIGRTAMHPLAIAVVAICLLSLMVAGIAFALAPQRDPLGLSPSGRQLYVYAGELLLALLFVHVRLTVPELFMGQLGKYWMFIVMAIAYIGVGLSEYFERRGVPILAQPLQRTGVYLPLLPLLAFWVKPPAAVQAFARNQLPGLQPMLRYLENVEQDFGKYALQWLLVGMLYAIVAVTRQSFRFAVFAAVAANCALWALYAQADLSFLLHPQMWLIPLALIVLIAEFFTRDELTPQQSAALRYGALLAIYVSSTADMFLAGIGNSIVWPLVLTVLSILGVLAGILLQVRAFLYLGVSFLFVVLGTMIWHAAVQREQIWVWWVSGIVLGAAIFALFAVFEKRRNDVLRMLQDIKRWD